jgi:hypothetical protein
MLSPIVNSFTGAMAVPSPQSVDQVFGFRSNPSLFSASTLKRVYFPDNCLMRELTMDFIAKRAGCETFVRLNGIS